MLRFMLRVSFLNLYRPHEFYLLLDHHHRIPLTNGNSQWSSAKAPTLNYQSPILRLIVLYLSIWPHWHSLQQAVPTTNHVPPLRLTTYTLRFPTICPTESIPHCPKRRKIAIPPSVDYHATTTSKHSTSTIPTKAKSIDEGLIKNALWHVLDRFNDQGLLNFEKDAQVPVWAKQHAEARLQLPENTLDS